MTSTLLALSLAAAIQAGVPVSEDPNKERIRKLEAQVEVLTRRLETIEQSTTPAAKPSAPPEITSAQTPDDPMKRSEPVTVVSDSAAGTAAPLTEVAAGSPPQVPPGPLDRSLGAPASRAEFQLSASSASSLASFAITKTRSEATFGPDGRGLGRHTSLTLGVQAPLDKDADFSDLATLDGLANSFALKIGFAQFRVPLAEPGAAMVELQARAVAKCRADPKVNPAVDCDLDTNRQTILSAYLPASDYRRYLEGGFPGTAIAFGINGRVGYRKFTFLNPLTGGEESLDRVPWSIGSYATLLPGVSAASLTAGVEYQAGFEEGSTGVICPVASTTAPFACATGPIRGPGRTNKLLVSLDARRLFPTGVDLIPTVDIAPQATLDALSGKVGVDLPIYLVADDKGSLLGGVRLGWTSKGGAFVAGVFVGTAFSLFQ